MQEPNLSETYTWKPNIVVLGPGGAKGFLEMGALKRLIECDFLSEVTHWTGCSIGSSIALLLISGYTIREVIDVCLDVNLTDDIGSIKLDEIKEKMGLIKNKTVEEKLTVKIKQKFGLIPSLKQLYLITGIIFTVVTYNMDKMRPEYLDKDSDPDLPVIDAIMMSMAVPGLIQPRIYKANVYVDGAIGDPYPILIHDNGENNILGLYISSEQDLTTSDKKPLNFIYRLFHASMKVLRDKNIKMSSDKCKHIPLKTLIRDTTGLSVTEESRINMVDHGYKCGDSFLKRIQNPDKYNLILDDNEEIPTAEDLLSGGLGVLSLNMYNMINKIVTEGKDEDLYVSDLLSNEEIDLLDDETLVIPITDNIQQKLSQSHFK